MDVLPQHVVRDTAADRARYGHPDHERGDPATCPADQHIPAACGRGGGAHIACIGCGVWCGTTHSTRVTCEMLGQSRMSWSSCQRTRGCSDEVNHLGRCLSR